MEIGHYFDLCYVLLTLRVSGEVNWCPGTLAVQMEDCQVKKHMFSWLDSFVQWERHYGVRQDSANCHIHLNYLTLVSHCISVNLKFITVKQGCYKH